MAVTGKASWSFYVVALLAQGATTATSVTVQQHPYHDTDHNASRASAHTQAPTLQAVGVACLPGKFLGVGTVPGWAAGNFNGAVVDGGFDDSATQHHLCFNKVLADASCDTTWYTVHTNDGNCFCFQKDSTCSLHYSSWWRTYGSIPFPPAAPSATGDPHLQNIYGQRFDLMQTGVHVLVQIPRHAAIDETLFTVEAAASRLGGNCEDLYFQTVNVTGAWADEAQGGAVRFDANSGGEEEPMWATFGPVAVKVAHGRTEQGTKYLNVYVKHLERAGFAVGGLLGEDDHDEVSTSPAACKKIVSLEKARSHLSSRGSSAASIAEGTLA